MKEPNAIFGTFLIQFQLCSKFYPGMSQFQYQRMSVTIACILLLSVISGTIKTSFLPPRARSGQAVQVPENKRLERKGTILIRERFTFQRLQFLTLKSANTGFRVLAMLRESDVAQRRAQSVLNSGSPRAQVEAAFTRPLERNQI